MSDATNIGFNDAGNNATRHINDDGFNYVLDEQIKAWMKAPDARFETTGNPTRGVVPAVPIGVVLKP